MVAVCRRPLNAVTSCRGSMRYRGDTRRAVVHHAYRGRRCQCVAASDSQHIAHPNVLPLRNIMTCSLNGGTGVFLTRTISRGKHCCLPPSQAEQQDHQPVCNPFCHIVEIQSGYINGFTLFLLPVFFVQPVGYPSELGFVFVEEEPEGHLVALGVDYVAGLPVADGGIH